jgi:hypothetical protein
VRSNHPPPFLLTVSLSFNAANAQPDGGSAALREVQDGPQRPVRGEGPGGERSAKPQPERNCEGNADFFDLSANQIYFTHERCLIIY